MKNTGILELVEEEEDEIEEEEGEEVEEEGKGIVVSIRGVEEEEGIEKCVRQMRMKNTGILELVEEEEDEIEEEEEEEVEEEGKGIVVSIRGVEEEEGIEECVRQMRMKNTGILELVEEEEDEIEEEEEEEVEEEGKGIVVSIRGVEEEEGIEECVRQMRMKNTGILELVEEEEDEIEEEEGRKWKKKEKELVVSIRGIEEEEGIEECVRQIR